MNKRLARFWKLVTYDLETKIGFTIVSGFLIISLIEAVFGNLILPYNPLTPYTGKPFSPPSLAHPFGTEELGRDMLSRVIAGAPVDAMISLYVVGLSIVVGVSLGILAGYVGGVLDEAMMRIVDVLFTVPRILLAMVIVIILGPSPINAMIALQLLWWPYYTKLARAETLKLVNTGFVESARLSGVGIWRILTRHILPNGIQSIFIYATMDVGTVILGYSGLAYLGLAVRPPYPDWGFMISQYQQFLLSAPWLSLIPGAVIATVAIGFNFLGEGMNAALQSPERA
jgi:peptide/nickel transport system permease protein